jgi:hypothetical protein
MRRRDVLQVLSCGLCLPALAFAQESAGQFDAPLLESLGCALDDGQVAVLSNHSRSFSAISDTLIESSGDAVIDARLGRALVRLAQAFGQRPGFGFYDDSRGKNAYAARRSIIPGTWGTVFYGKNMFEEIMQKADDGGMAALTIVAHEFAHIAQFKAKADRKLMEDQTTVKRVELHADYLAGWYLGTLRRAEPRLKLWSAGKTIYEIGDENFNDPNHHGTPDERVAASEKGYALGVEGVPFTNAFDRGIEYVIESYP